MIPVGEALARVLEATHALGAERVTILDALGRVAAEDVVSRRAVPAAPYSATMCARISRESSTIRENSQGGALPPCSGSDAYPVLRPAAIL